MTVSFVDEKRRRNHCVSQDYDYRK